MIKFLHIYLPVPVILLGIVDVVALYLAIAGGLALSYAPETVFLSFFSDEFAPQKIAFILICSTSLFVIGAYSRTFLTDMKMALLAIIIAHFMTLAVLSITFYAFPDLQIWRSALIPGLLLSVVGVFLVHVIFDRIIGTRIFKRNLLVLGLGPLARKVADVAERSPYLTCVGFVPSGEAKIAAPDAEILREDRSLLELTKDYKIDEVVVAVEERRDRLETEQLLLCRLNGVQVSQHSSFIERQEGHVEIDGLYPSWMIFGPGFSSATPGQRTAKRAFDFVISLLLLGLTLPIMIATALAVRISGRGPIFYRQGRVGLNGADFTIWKFRSMAVEAETDGVARWASPDDARTTVVGRVLRRLRLDELPQLWNVLRGDMSFIGPRPERPDFVRQLVAQIPYYDCRHIVKPGISGWAQINFPYGATFEDAKEKLKYDLYYIKNYSLALDFVVLLQTLRVIIWPIKGTRQLAAETSESDAGHASEADPFPSSRR